MRKVQARKSTRLARRKCNQLLLQHPASEMIHALIQNIHSNADQAYATNGHRTNEHGALDHWIVVCCYTLSGCPLDQSILQLALPPPRRRLCQSPVDRGHRGGHPRNLPVDDFTEPAINLVLHPSSLATPWNPLDYPKQHAGIARLLTHPMVAPPFLSGWITALLASLASLMTRWT